MMKTPIANHYASAAKVYTTGGDKNNKLRTLFSIVSRRLSIFWSFRSKRHEEGDTYRRRKLAAKVAVAILSAVLVV